MLLNPEQFSIIQSKGMGLWPPPDLTATAMMPYVRRMKDKVTLLDVGTRKGENVYRFLELDTQNKIDKIYTTDDEYDPMATDNLKPYGDRVVFSNDVTSVDLVSVNSSTNLNETLDKYYAKVKHGGIFCGNNHSETFVKEALSKFRRTNRIGTPIMIAYDTWFWYVR